MPRKEKVLLIACTLSVVINLGFIGYFVGKAIAPGFQAEKSSTLMSVPMDRFLHPLGPKRIAELAPLTEEHRTHLGEHMKKLRSAQVELYRATVAEPFDEVRLSHAQDAFNELFLAAKQRHDRMWLEVSANLEPNERRRIMRQSMPRRYDETRRRGKQGETMTNDDTSDTH